MNAVERARSLVLKHFSAEELLVHAERPGNCVPPTQIAHNIDCVAALVDHMREDLGFAIKINSGFRSPEYNKKVGGRRLSQHQLWKALDPAPVSPTPSRVRQMYEWAIRARGRVFEVVHRRRPFPLYGDESWVPRLEDPVGAGDPRILAMLSTEIESHPLQTWRSGEDSYLFRFAGGVGRYPWGIHVDTRGINRTWSGS